MLSWQGWCINTCKEKANEIMAAARAIHPDAIMRAVSSFLSNGANVNFQHEHSQKCLSLCNLPCMLLRAMTLIIKHKKIAILTWNL